MHLTLSLWKEKLGLHVRSKSAWTFFETLEKKICSYLIKMCFSKEYMDTAQSFGVAHLTHVDRELVVERGKGVVVGKQPSGAFVFLKRRAVERVGKVAGEFSDWISAKLHKEMEFVDIASSSQFFKVQQRDALLALSNSPKLKQYSGEVAKEVDECNRLVSTFLWCLTKLGPNGLTTGFSRCSKPWRSAVMYFLSHYMKPLSGNQMARQRGFCRKSPERATSFCLSKLSME
jgi:hypothetical protein